MKTEAEGYSESDRKIESDIECIADELGYDSVLACLQSHWGPHSEVYCNIFSGRERYDGYYDKAEVRAAHASGNIREWVEVTLIQAIITGEMRGGKS